VVPRVFHEAAHVVAARTRGRPVSEIYIHPDNGYTSHGSDGIDYKGDDHQFIVYAGTWAEVRALWVARGIGAGAHDAQGNSFADAVRILLRKNDSDWLEYHQAMGRDYDSSHRRQARDAYDSDGDPPDETPPDPSWHPLYQEMWPEIIKVGLTMLAGEQQLKLGTATLARIGPRRWILPPTAKCSLRAHRRGLPLVSNWERLAAT
jgi:hypothetical protein